MKKLLCLIFCVLVILSTASCGDSNKTYMQKCMISNQNSKNPDWTKDNNIKGWCKNSDLQKCYFVWEKDPYSGRIYFADFICTTDYDKFCNKENDSLYNKLTGEEPFFDMWEFEIDNCGWNNNDKYNLLLQVLYQTYPLYAYYCDVINDKESFKEAIKNRLKNKDDYLKAYKNLKAYDNGNYNDKELMSIVVDIFDKDKKENSETKFYSFDHSYSNLSKKDLLNNNIKAND